MYEDDDGDYWKPRRRVPEAEPIDLGQQVGSTQGGNGAGPGGGRGVGYGHGHGGGHAGKKPARRRGRSALKWIAIGTGAVVLAVAGVGAYVYVHLNGNIATAALLPPGVTQSAEIPDQFGRTQLNVLVIGSDTRETAADCSLGGACTGNTAVDAAQPQHADVEMVVHLSADRSNATVMSIPRDTVVQLPACAGGRTDRINSALAAGPGCQVDAVHELTGLTIDDFIKVDMAGVVDLSNALGGVQVCVTNNVYDSYSHLKLPKGNTTIQGVQALEWLRTRHAFGDEIFREQAQHYFLSAMIRKLKANASLTHVTTLYGVADAATKALTVSPQLGGVSNLLSLAQEFGKVPTSRITMLTMPWDNYSGPDTADFSQAVQVLQPAAGAMFAALKADQPYTAPTTTTAGSSGTTGTTGTTTQVTSAPASANPGSVNKAQVHVAIQNGSGVDGRAATLRTALGSAGFSSSLISTTTRATPAASTVVYYPSTRADSAAAVAGALGIPSADMHESGSYSQVTVVVGKDWTSGATFSSTNGTGSGSGTGTGGGSGGQPVTVASSPPADSFVSNAADNTSCMAVPYKEW